MCCLQHFKLKHEPVIWCQCFDLEWQKSQFSLCACSSPNSRNNLLKGQGDAAWICRTALLPWEAGTQTPSFNFFGSQKLSAVMTHSAVSQPRLLECLYKSTLTKILFFSLIKSYKALIHKLDSNFGRNLKICSSAFGSQLTVLLLRITTVIQRLSNKSIWDSHKIGYLHQAPDTTPVKKKILLIFALISVILHSHTYQEIHKIQLLSSGLLVC